jgi:hypothetical protein
MVFSLRILEGAGIRGRTRIRPVIAAIVLILIFFAAPRPAAGEVYHVDIPAAGGFPGAAAPAALSLACAERADQLARYFDSRRLPFDPALVRKPGQARCHIYYEPTIRGFRAHPDSAPIQ